MSIEETNDTNQTMLFKIHKHSHAMPKGKRYAISSVWITIGYILSPLSWWNDMVVNVPLAYVFSIPFALVSEHLFLPAFVLGYWLTNLAGFILLHKGVTGFVDKQNHKSGIVRHLAIASLYTLVIVLMVWLEWIPIPTELINKTS